MQNTRLCATILAAVAAGVVCSSPAADQHAPQTLIAVAPNLDLNRFEKKNAEVQIVDSAGRNALLLKLGHKDRWPGVVFVPEKAWDLSNFGCVTVEVKNTGNAPIRFGCRLDSPAVQGKPATIQTIQELAPGKQNTIRVKITRHMSEELATKLFGMRGYPGGFQEKQKTTFNPASVNRLNLFVGDPKADSTIEIYSVRAEGRPPLPLPADSAKWFPMIDRFGQYIHGEWPGKIHDESDFAARRTAEADDIQKHPGPGDWDPYGGWLAGPKLEATGRFRVARHKGKWWLVDPDGRLFWSHGIDCVRMDNATPITDRRHYFAALPSPGDPLAVFYGKGSWAPHGYYQGKKYETFNFTGSNLARKYGADWNGPSRENVHRRLRSWGMNTIANWSDPKLFADHKTAYTATVGVRARPLEGSTGYWGKFHDVFDPNLREVLRKSMEGHKAAASDPWCVGFFVDNELSWGEELSLAAAALASPADQPAKLAMLGDLKTKYATIEALNQAWGTRHSSWDGLRESRDVPDKKKAYDDLAAFATRTAETYFRTCRDAVKEASPQALYLGCRFAWINDRAVRAAAKYCDVVSYNLYRDSIAEFRLPDGIDVPLVVGEFHFGALDRGMFHTGLRPVEDQAARARAYANYVHGALSHANFVGTHWFQYGDQATTGRGDGENYQIGFVDVADTPYAETISACREVGYSLYAKRLEKKP